METADEQDLNPPQLVVFSGGDWETYQEELYAIYCESLRDAALLFRGTKVVLQRKPEYKGKPSSFWHLTSEGEIEAERTPDLRRCERLRWIAWIIQASDSHPEISSWENERRGDRRVVIWLEKENYAVILAKRNGYYVLKSAYLLNPHRATAFRAEREEYFRSIKP